MGLKETDRLKKTQTFRQDSDNPKHPPQLLLTPSLKCDSARKHIKANGPCGFGPAGAFVLCGNTPADCGGEPLEFPGNQQSDFSSSHQGSQVTPLICQYNRPPLPRPTPPPVADSVRMRQRGALLCSAALLRCAAALLLCARKGRTRRGESSWERSRKERTGSLLGCTDKVQVREGRKRWRDEAGGEMDLCDSPRGLVGARLVPFICAERPMMTSPPLSSRRGYGRSNAFFYVQ